MSTQTTLGFRLKAYRKVKNLSGEGLGELLGLGRSAVSHIETGKVNPTIEGVIKLLNNCPDLNAEWLLIGKGNMLKEESGIESQQSINSDAETCWDLLKREEEQHNKLKEDYRVLKSRLRKDKIEDLINPDEN